MSKPRREPPLWYVRFLRPLSMVSAVFLAGGCAAAVATGSIVTTDKTPIDQAWSIVTGKHCSIVRLQQGATWCVEDEIVPPVTVSCYPTLGEVSCYASPDPYPGKHRTVTGERTLAAAPMPSGADPEAARSGRVLPEAALSGAALPDPTPADPTLADPGTAPPVAAATEPGPPESSPPEPGLPATR